MSPKTKRKLSKGTGQKYQHERPIPSSGAQVIYIHPAKQGLRYRQGANLGRPYGLIPVGVPAIVNLLRQNNIPVKGIDHSLEVELNKNFSLKNWLLSQHGARVFIIDMHWYEHCFGAIDTAITCKQIHPDAWVVLGGLSASGFANEILEFCQDVDIIIRGDGEYPLLSLVRHLLTNENRETTIEGLSEISNLTYRTPSEIVANPLGYTGTTVDLDQLNYVDLDFLEHAREYAVHEYLVTDIAQARQALSTGEPFRGRWLTTARGCRYECAYCGGAKSAHKVLANRHGIITRSPEVVVDELARLEEQGFQQAALAYDIAELGEAYWNAFFNGIQRRGIRIGLYNECFQMPAVDFIQAYMQCCIKEHSCLTLSPLSGNERVRRLNGKHFSNEQLFDMLDILRQYESYLIVYFSLNLPGETNETFKETIDMARDIFYMYPNHLLKILNSVHTIDPLSPMNLRAERYGVQSSMKTFGDFYNYCQNTQELSPASRTGEHRGFELVDPSLRSLEWMADAWDLNRAGREESWWPIPPGW
jgi:hypothetical protein